MAQIRHRDPKTGTVYVYSSHKKWDKERKKYRAVRKLIGKLDADGKLVSTGPVGRHKKEKPDSAAVSENLDYKTMYESEHQLVEDVTRQLTMEKQKNMALSLENERLISTLSKMLHVAQKECPEIYAR